MTPWNALWTLLVLLGCRVSTSVTTSNRTERMRASISAYSVTAELRNPPLWAPLPVPWLRLARHGTAFFARHTRWGQPIPGLASNSSCCGRSNVPEHAEPTVGARIAGGRPAGRHQFPWLAALVRPGKHEPFCGGSLINDRYVLTAAHCLPRRRPHHMQVILGKHALLSDSGGDLRLNVSSVRRHPLFGPLLLRYDLGLVRLQTPLQLPLAGNRVSPICLPERGLYRLSPVTAAGWGTARQGGPRPDRLHSVELKQVPSALCRLLNVPVPVSASMVCAAGNVWTGGRDSCQGDSGGPLTVSVAGAKRTESRHALLGVTSWGLGCARPISAGVYARVPAALDWILANTEDAAYC